MTACGWDFEVVGCAAYDGMDTAQQTSVRDMAANFLSAWTEHQFGVCPVAVRPCREGCERGTTFDGRSPFQRVHLTGGYATVGCFSCSDDLGCGCSRTPAVRLPGPIHEVTEVKVDGAVLPTSDYRVDNGTWLVRLGGGQWPTCQNMALGTDQENTWEVSYGRGLPIPSGGLEVASLLACEFAKALTKSRDCQLPERIKQVTRQGVTTVLMDDFKDVEEGRTGIWIIDSWVASVTKTGKPSRVYSPDLRRPKSRRTTWSG